MTKPKYLVPSMSEISSIEPSGLRCISTFSGGGGSTLGYRMAGIDVVWANEFVDAARSVYEVNNPTTFVDPRDIREIAPDDVLQKIGLEVGEVDIMDGSPPCSSFSMVGKRDKGWGDVSKYSDVSQRTDDLFFEYIRLLRGIQPRSFVAENVKGMTMGSAKGYFKEVFRGLESCGYRVRAKVLDAQWLGVPQRRQRVIFLGVRNDLDCIPEYPNPLPYNYSIREALEGVDPYREPESDISNTQVGKELARLECGEQSEKYFSLVRSHPHKPCPTITASCCTASTGALPPTGVRMWSIAELKRLFSFPDDYKLLGGFRKRGERLGRSVPPVMMYHIASSLKGCLA